MNRIPVILMITMLMFLGAGRASAEELTAMMIFDYMIHYESDQLTNSPSIEDYHCKVTQATQRTGISVSESVVKDLFFMVPTFQLYVVDGEPMGYFDDDMLMVLLETNELTRERDQTINGIACYGVKTVPIDPAFAQYSRTYFVARDDFRHVRTVSHHANAHYDHLYTTIDYEYEMVDDFLLLSRTVAETKDENENVLAVITSTYSDYDFGLNLDLQFFKDILDRVGGEPIPSWN